MSAMTPAPGNSSELVTPAKAGAQLVPCAFPSSGSLMNISGESWAPAFAEVTIKRESPRSAA